ncbi:MAG: DUF4336 domain-containing protein [Maritimibacter sp.]
MLQHIGEDAWITDGTHSAQNFGFCYTLRMVVIRLTSGDLWVWSPIPLSEDLAAEIVELGKVRHIVSPNAFHHLSISQWQAAYPDATLFAAPGLTKRRADLSPGFTFGKENPPWENEISTVLFRGNLLFEEAVFFHHASGTLIFTDILQNTPKEMNKGWRKRVALLDKMSGDEPQVPRKFRITFRDKTALKQAISQVQAFPVSTVVVAHGDPVTKDAPEFLRRAFSWA